MLFLKGNSDCALRFLSAPTVLPSSQNIGGIHTLLSYGVVTGLSYGVVTGGDDPESRHIRCGLRFAKLALFAASRSRLLWSCAFSFMRAYAGESRCKASLKGTYSGSETTFCCTKGISAWSWYTAIHLSISPTFDRNRINIDTGAYATGQLTCLVLEGDSVTFI
jgi:serine/threonine protein phosphatase 1